ncbi:filamentous hemagglutinin N-terminal domain-containing protein [Nostoc sp. FACHB-110]|uniref:two-partner secretion domain-containing protein n=1 Tax=Nostoc sp. FACHB-110 TaxID=2692834 RepID=UPI00168A15E7|nr:filamentous hemagglutinin N-terminal domain-containing protein [Nostoc sp. FACHB-110]MBD2438440.1 filamentous hemagglutinin N-terminal domain-containing protein [Nostoc sp. FACHB-110]
MSAETIYFSWLQGLKIALACSIILAPHEVIAQITPDSTLPNNSQVRLEGTTNIIEGGTTRNTNLFHSFQEFSIPNNTSAFFNNAGNIQNIFTRITGNSISRINGLISANGTANLFLLNPNGIIFGENARLNVGGSFLATTANAIKFADNFEFSATSLESKPLLTISLPISLQFGVNPRLIQVQGNGQGARDFNPSIFDTQEALRVQPNRTLALVGGEINLEGATLKTAGGRIELGSVAGNGSVSWTAIDKGFALDYGGVQNFGKIQLSQQSTIDASGEGGGDIQVVGKNVTLTNRSQIEASTLGAKPGGFVVVTATELLEISGDYSYLSTSVYPQATGNAGQLTIKTRDLQVSNGAFVSTFSFGPGKGGNLTVTADNVEVIGRSTDGQFGSAFTTSSQGNLSGDAGNLTINTRNLLIKNGAQVTALTFGQGKAGNLTVNADNVQLVGIAADGRAPSGLSASTAPYSSGDAGNLTINTRNLLVQNGAQVSAGTRGQGKGGNLTVNADNVQLLGSTFDYRFTSGLFVSTQLNSMGDAGNLTINTRNLLVKDGAQVSAGTFSQGKGGNLTVNADNVQILGTANNLFPSGLFTSSEGIATGDSGELIINTRNLLVQNGAKVNADTRSQGKGGNLTISAESVQVIGTSANNRYVSELSTSSNEQFSGDAGNLTIITHDLLLQNGARIGAVTFGQGKGGNVYITSENLQVIGTSVNNLSRTIISTSSLPNSRGDAGDLTINTRNLLVQNGAQISAATLGQGQGGNLSITSKNIQVIGASADGLLPSSLVTSSDIDSSGNAGDLTIKTRQLQVHNGAGIFVNSQSPGNAGNLTIDAHSISLDNHATFNANTRSVNSNPNRPQATININSKDLILVRGSNITTNARGENVIGGNININTDVLAAAENSDISANSTDFRGGNVNITTQGIFGIQFRNALTPESDITATGANSQLNGNVQINTPDVDPNNGLVELPIEGVDASSLISQNFCAVRGGSSFTITGRGGLPPSPNEVLNANAVWEDWELTAVATDNRNNHHPPVVQSLSEPTQIVPAQGWVINRQGEVTLIAAVPTATLDNLRNLPSGCQAAIAP